MKILLVNDDGIRAPGIQALYREVARLGHEVCVVAPSDERSAVSHAITWKKPLKAREVQTESFVGYEVEGTPADCTRMGLWEFYPQADLVLSGINAGANLGMDTLYSGTVSAAMEGVMRGKPALAVSHMYTQDFDYDVSARVGGVVLEYIKDHPLPQGTMCNLNVPALPLEQIRGIRLAGLDPAAMVESYERFDSQLSGSWYFLKLGRVGTPQAGSDRELVQEKRFAAITLLQWKLASKEPFDLSGIVL